MTTMTTTPAGSFGHGYSDASTRESYRAYVNDGGYTDDQQDALVDALVDALRAEVDARLPEDWTWQPGADEFLHPAYDDPELDMQEVFEDAQAAVEARFDKIEAEALGGLATTATANVITGEITIRPADATDTDIYTSPDGKLVGLATNVEPWGEDELGMDRADAALAELGWQRVGDWSGSETLTCHVQISS